MLRHQWNRPLLIVLASLAAGSIALPAVAANGRWHLRAHAVWNHPDLDWRTSPDPGDVVTIQADDAWGVGISGEYQVSDLLGVDMGILRTTPDIRIVAEDRDLGISLGATDGLTMTPLSIGLNFHVAPASRFDIYLGPFLAYVLYGDLQWRVNETVDVAGTPIVFDETLQMSVANDLAYGAVAGVDIPLGPGGWFFSGAVKYMSTELDATSSGGEGENLSLDPVLVTVGVRYSF